jgi:hypothetical protein
VLADLSINMKKTFVIAGLLFLVTVTAGCAHRTNPSDELQRQLAPFTQTRNQTVALVKTAKHSLGPLSLNRLQVSYSDLEIKANEYAGFLAESVNVNSFDADRNNQYSGKLKAAIDAFENSFETFDPTQVQAMNISSAWVPAFADSVKAYWTRYHTSLTTASPQAKAALIRQLKSDTVWPNFENIATEPVSAAPTP